MPIKDPEKRKARQRICQANWYRLNSKKQRDAATQRRRELFSWFREYKASLVCVRCGEDHPSCLDFHHTDPKEKDKSLQQLLTSKCGKDRILKEIMKCEAICSNCHRKLHWNESHSAGE